MAKQSPFPGMDPYLERHWRDVHANLIALSRTALNNTLPNDLIARMEERVVIDRVDHTDYNQSCDPPLEDEDAAWADGLLREAGLRVKSA